MVDKLPSSYKFNPVVLDHKPTEKRRIIRHLPGVNQTESLQKFFGSTVDHLFNPGEARPINGYVGQYPVWHNPSQDHYIEEINRERSFYQLESTMVSRDSEGSVSSMLFYPDLINQLRFQGANTSNHNRLFEQEFYTWCPPIDLDKIINFRQYYWVGEGPEAHDIVGPMDVYTGNGSTTTFELPHLNDINSSNYYNPALVDPSLIKIMVDEFIYEFNTNNEVLNTFTYDAIEKTVTLNPVPAEDAEIRIWVNSDFDQYIIGQTAQSLDPIATGGVKLSSNMRIRITNDINPTYNGKYFIVEGMGESLRIIEDTPSDLSAEYLVMARGCQDGNPWSLGNRWFHKDTIKPQNLETLKANVAVRPIVEFKRDLKLFNYGTTRRLDVDLVCTGIPNVVSAIHGKSVSDVLIDGISLDLQYIIDNAIDPTLPSVRVLLTDDSNEAVNNKVYLVTILNGKMRMSPETEGVNPTGEPEVGEIVKIKAGDRFGSQELYWDGISWQVSQKKNGPQFPLFDLFDYDGIPLSDPETYPNSTFKGSRLFTYQENSSGSRAIDDVLKFRTIHDRTGQFVFQNHLATETFQYGFGSDVKNIAGFYFNKTNATEFSDSKLSNDWYRASYNSRQMMVDRFLVKDGNSLFQLSQTPAEVSPETPSSLVVTRGRIDADGNYQNVTLNRYDDFFLNGTAIAFSDAKEGDIIEVKTYNPATPVNPKGFYEVPLNLQANPNYEEISTLAKGDYYVQFADVIRNQPDFEGAEYDSNNWRDSVQERFRGAHIVQHSASLMKTMLLASNESLDLMNSTRFVETEYGRFRAKFEQKIGEFINSGKLTNQDSLDKWVDTALEEINKGKTSSFPFYYSGVGVTSDHPLPTFIPATPSYLGVHNLFVPRVFADTTLENPQYFLQGHDGSLTLLYGDIRDYAILNLEQRIYDSAPESVRTVERPIFDASQWVSGKFRKSSYTYAEFLSLLQPSFERWTSVNSLDYRTNDTFDINDPLTWNWSSVEDQQGEKLHGHWRGIFNYYFDTDRPHSHPWEMLGFNSEPSWWLNRYGPAPYSRDNHILWTDLEEGRIFAGQRKGIHPRYARPGLKSFIPVNSSGKLLDPLACGITKNQPSMVRARANWQWGDGSPVETLWRRSQVFSFAMAQAGYLMKPAMFVEMGWDTKNVTKIFRGDDNEQFINSDSKHRAKSADLVVHGEALDGKVVTHVGIQQWISDYLISKNSSITENFGNLIRGLGVNLAYKFGGFTDSNTLNLVTDSFDRVPTEDVSVQLYRSPSIREEFYGGAIVEWTGYEWKIFGYDVLNPYFKILAPDKNGTAISITTGNRPARVVSWKASTYFTVGVTVRFGDNFYQCVKTHTSSQKFEAEYWSELADRPARGDNQVAWYLEKQVDAKVEQIAYGSSFKNLQDVVDVINGYERYLVDAGWEFDYSSDGLEINDWQQSVKSLLVWQEGDLKIGDFVALSPLSQRVRYRSAHGAIQSTEQIINGLYSINDRLGNPIDPRNTNVVRGDDDITITHSNVTGGIFGVRLYVSEIEHVVVLNNSTIFNDTIYNPLLNIKQPRVRIQGYRSENWQGRVDAPGFIVTDNRIVPNFERAADDFRRIFDIEGLENKSLQDRARANLGYQERDYLNELMMTSTNQFEFYQGMVQEKGTKAVLNKLLRSNFIRNNKDIKFFDEWAFRAGDYGSSEVQPSLEVILQQKEFHNNPQLIEFETLKVNDVTEFSTDLDDLNKFINEPGTSLKSYEIWNLPQSVDLMDLKVEVIESLTGQGAMISVGDSRGTQSLFKSTAATSIFSYAIDFSSDPVSYTENESIRVYIPQSVTDGHIRVSGTYKVKAHRFFDLADDKNTDSILSIRDIYSNNSNTHLFKDSRWVSRDPTVEISWPTRTFKQRERGLLPNAGYVNLDDVKWFARDLNDFETLVGDSLSRSNPIITRTVEFKYDGISSNPQSASRVELIPNNTRGFYRVKSIKLDVTEAFVEDSATLKIGTKANDSAFLDTTGHLSNLETHMFYPFELIDNRKGSNTAIYVTYEHNGLAPLGVDIGKVSVTVEVEHLINGILPDDRSWVYDTGAGDWMTYRMSDTGVNILGINDPSYDGQGSVVILSENLPDNLSGNHNIVISGMTDELNKVHRIKTSGQARTTITGKEDVIPAIMNLVPDADMVIDRITLNVVKAFSGGNAPATIAMGSTENEELFLNRYTPVSDPSKYENAQAKKPVFLHGQPIEIDVFDTDLVIAEGQSNVEIEVVRSGNIFISPSSISVTNPGQGYTSVPEVVVTGPEGVKATAVISGGIQELVIKNGGEGYTSAPTVEVIGDGNGAILKVLPTDMEDGRIISVTVENSGYGYTSAPQIIFKHAYGENAEATAVMNYGVERVLIKDIGKCNYSGSVAPVVTFSGGGVEPGVSGSHAVATVMTTPATPPVSSVSWRYREKGQTTWILPANNTLNFAASSNPGTSGKDHWLQVINLPIPSQVSKATTFEIQLFDAVGAEANDTIYEIKVANTAVDNRSVDLSSIGTTIIDGSPYFNEATLEAYIEANGNTGLLTVVVDYHYESGFELLDTAGQTVTTEAQLEGGDLWVWEETRFANDAALAAFQPVVPFKSEDKVEVDGSSWTVKKRVGSDWQIIRSQGNKVDSSQINKAAIYNSRTNSIEQVLQLYDPYKGIIPGVADRELHYKLPYDPAGYNAGSEDLDLTDKIWGQSQVGRLWWDLSTVRYLDYESDSTEYRWKNWGKLAPRTSIDVYEWTESTTHPLSWNGDGEVMVENRLGWVETTRWNTRLQTEEVVYYFWLKNVGLPSNLPERELTARQVANVIADPVSNDIPYFSVIEDKKIIVGGVKQFLTDNDTVLKVNWNIEGNEGNHHKQWMLIREGDARNTVDFRQWNKMVDSIVGWDDYSEIKEVSGMHLVSVVDSMTETLTVNDASGLLPSGEIEINGYWFTYSWKTGNTLHGILNTTDRIFQPGTPVKQKSVISKPRLVPDPMLTKTEALGNQIRPRQSWFEATDQRPSRQARKILIESINDILSKQPFVDVWYNWRDVFEAGDQLPAEHLYSFVAPDMTYRDALVDEKQVEPGQRILLNDPSAAHGFWTLWRYDPSSPLSDYKGLVMESAQKWRMQQDEMWQYRDWYAEGWSTADFPNYRFANRAARDAANIEDETLLKGTLVQIDSQDENDPRWSWSVYSNGGWTLVAMENGTIELKDAFYREGTSTYGLNGFDLNAIANRDGSHELRWLFGHFYDHLFSKVQVNQLFFDMVKAAFALNQKIDWAFKTSFLYLGGYSEKLQQSPIAFKDQIDNVVKYIEEVKPYHVKIRDYVRRLSTGPDISNWTVTDFDKPVYVMGSMDYRTLRFNEPADALILSQEKPWKDWYENYQNPNANLAKWDADWNPVRRIKTRLLFDRIASDAVSGWDVAEVPWDSNEDHYTGTHDLVSSGDLIDSADPYGDIAVRTMDDRNRLVRNREIDAGTIVTVSRDDTQWIWDGIIWHQIWAVSWDKDWASSMVDRVNQYYEPRGSMKRKVFDELLDGVSFRETTSVGEPFAQGMFDQYTWDFESGWGNEREVAVGIDVNIKGQDFMEVSWVELIEYDEVDYPGLAASLDAVNVENGNTEEAIGNFDYLEEPSSRLDDATQEIIPTIKVLKRSTTREMSGDLTDTDEDGLVEIPVFEPQPYDHLTSAADLNETLDLYGVADILVDGGEFVQPHVDSEHPDELVKVRSRSPVSITVHRKASVGATETAAIRMFKNGLEVWEFIKVKDQGVTLVGDLTVSYTKNDGVIIQAPTNVFPFFDPNNPPQALIDSITMSRIDESVDGDSVLQAIKNQYSGVIWINNERLEYRAVEALPGNQFKLLGVLRGTGSTPHGGSPKGSTGIVLPTSSVNLDLVSVMDDNLIWDNKANHLCITYLMSAPGKPSYSQRLNVGSDYVINGTNVVLVKAPTLVTGSSDDYVVDRIVVQTQLSDWMDETNVVHPHGSQVIDGSVMSRMPGGRPERLDGISEWNGFINPEISLNFDNNQYWR